MYRTAAKRRPADTEIPCRACGVREIELAKSDDTLSPDRILERIARLRVIAGAPRHSHDDTFGPTAEAACLSVTSRRAH